MPQDIPSVRFFRTNDARGTGVSALYAIHGDAFYLDGSVRSPEGYQAVMWAAGALSTGVLSKAFLDAYTREIGALYVYDLAPEFYRYILAHRNDITLAS